MISLRRFAGVTQVIAIACALLLGILAPNMVEAKARKAIGPTVRRIPGVAFNVVTGTHFTNPNISLVVAGCSTGWTVTGVSVTLNGSAVTADEPAANTCSGGLKTTAYPVLVAGANTLVGTVCDDNGDCSTKTITLYYDPPPVYAATVVAASHTNAIVRTTSSSTSFTVTHTGNADGHLRIVVSCSGALAATAPDCTSNYGLDSTRLWTHGSSSTVTVSYKGVSTGTGGAKVWVTFTENTTNPKSDSAVVTVTNLAHSVAVTPKIGTNWTYNGNSSSTQSYYVHNDGDSASTYSIAVACSGAALTSCSFGQTSVTLAAGGWMYPNVTVNTGPYSTTGQVVVRATWTGNSAVTDSGYIGVVIPSSPNPAVMPHNQSVLLPPDSVSYLLFSLQNTGGLTGSFALTTVCTGAATSCVQTTSANPVSISTGQFVAPQVQFTAAGYGTTGRVLLHAAFQLDTTKQDSGWFNFTTRSTAPSVTPKGTVVNPLPTTSAVTNFTIQNAGNTAGVYSLTASCSGAGIASGCSLSTSSASLSAGASTTVGVTYNTGARGAPGVITVRAVSTVHPALSDSGSVNVSVESHPALTVSPHVTAASYASGGPTSTTLTITNTGDATDTYNLVTHCGGTAFSTQCVLSNSQLTLAAGAQGTTTLSFYAGVPRATGQAAVVVTSGLNTTVRDSGVVNFTVSPRPFINITPKGGVKSGVTANTAGSQPAIFTVTTSGGTVSISAVCTGPAIAASGPCPTGGYAISALTDPFNYAPVFTTGPTGSAGRVKVIASLVGSNGVQDSAWVDLRVGTVNGAGVAVGPDSLNVMHVIPRTAIVDSFVVSNTGNASTTYNLTAACSGSAFNGACIASQSSITLAAGSWAMVPVSYTSGPGSSNGRLSLTAIASGNSAVRDSGWKYIYTSLSSTVSLSPRGGSASIVANDTGQVGFQVTNIGNTLTSYRLSASCWGQALGTLCGSAWPDTILTLSPNTASVVNVAFRGGSPGGTGRIKLLATPTNDPSLADSGWVDVSTSSSAVRAVSTSPHGKTVYVTPNSSGSIIFSLSNLGNQLDAYSVVGTCAGSGASCSYSPGATSWMAPGTMQQISVPYTAGAVGATSRMKFVATSTTSLSIHDSAWVDISTGTTGPTTVSVTPHNGSAHIPPPQIGSGSVTFIVQNTGTAAGTFLLTPVCTGSGLVGGCSASASSITLPAQGSQQVSVFVAGGAEGSGGSVLLRAQLSTNTLYADSGSYNVLVYTPHVSASPHGTTLSVQPNVPSFTSFTVTNSGSYSDYFQFSAACSGPGVSSCTQGFESISLAAGASTTLTVTFSAGAAGQTGRIWLNATPANSPGVRDTAWTTVVVFGGTPTVVVGPHGASQGSLTAGQAAQSTLSVQNVSPVAGTYSLSASCTWNSVPLSCSPALSSVTLTPNETQYIGVSFTPGTTGTSGTVALSASLNGASPAVVDSGWINISTTVAAGTPVSIVASSLNPGASFSRSHCLTAAAGADAAYECGDLRLVHTLPSIRTWNTEHTPALIFNSRHARPVTVVATNIKINHAAPASIKTVLQLPGHAPDTASVSWTSSCDQQFCRVAVRDTATMSDPTGWYPYIVQVTATLDGHAYTASDTGSLAIINRATSPFGSGWWLDGLEQLQPVSGDSTRKMWIGGDGSTRIYKLRSAGIYSVDQILDRPDTLRFVSSTQAYRRTLRGGGYVEFDALTGQHVRTVNRLNRATQFFYIGSRLDSIALSVPAGAAAVGYKFLYHQLASTQWVLDSVRAPAINAANPRKTAIAHDVAGNVTSITDPDGQSVTFQVGSGVLKRTNRFGDTTTFAFDEAGGLRQSRLDMSRTSSPGDAIVTNFCAAETVSHNPCSATMTPVDSAYTLLNGPRINVNVSRFRLNRFGAPTTIVDALGKSTQIVYDDSFPVLAKQTTDARGHVVLASYTSRGNVDSVTDANPYADAGDGRTAVTHYHYLQGVDYITKVVRPDGSYDSLTVDAVTGNRLTQEDARGDTSRVSFLYGSSGAASQQLIRVLRPVIAGGLVAPRDSLHYDGLGNLDTTWTPKGTWSAIARDAIGRDTLSTTPINDAQNRYAYVRTLYDVMDRPVLSASFGPQVQRGSMDVPTYLTAGDTVMVATHYDVEGRADTVTRSMSPNLASIASMKTSWRYDAAGRKLSERAPDGVADSLTYGDSVNVTRSVSRRGDTVTMQYDALNRLVGRMLPQTVSIGVHNDTLVVPGDVEVYRFDDAGNLTYAANAASVVTRDYYRNGLLKHEQQSVATATGFFGAHDYDVWYHYDMNGRRDRLDYPWQANANMDGVPVGSLTYHYANAGMLDSIVNGAARFGFHYNSRGLRDTLFYANGVREARTYDDDDQLIAVLQRSPVTLWPSNSVAGVSDTIQFFAMTRDRRGKLTGTSSFAGDTILNVYNGLGALRWQSKLNTHSSVQSTQVYQVDPLANIVSDTTTGQNASSSIATNNRAFNGVSGRLESTTITLPGLATGMSATYDGSGNQRTTSVGSVVDAFSSSGQTVPLGLITDVLHAYDGSGRLRKIRERGRPHPGLFVYPADEYTDEETRYDALGRRVWVHAVHIDTMHIACATECSTTRFSWDGNQLLAEFRIPDSVAENDVARVYALLPDSLRDTGTTYHRDYSWTWGQVAYVPGIAIDQPLAVYRAGVGFGTTQLASFAMYPHTNWNGVVTAISFDGSGPLNIGNILATPPLPTELNATLTAYGARTHGGRRVTSWLGSLLVDQVGENGLAYRRNRYFDPSTGRFTQEDPIGLAGGMNLYGFAGGDPVNYSDPFGLCPIPADDCPAGYWTALGTAAGAIIGGTGGGAGGFLAGFGVGAIPGGLAGAAQGAALGGAAGAAIDGIVFASKQSRAVGRAESLAGHIEDHLGKLGGDSDSPSANGWRKEVRAAVDNVQRQLKDMKGKTQEKWAQTVKEWTERLNELTPK